MGILDGSTNESATSAQPVDVNNWYRGVLGRDADPAGLDAWNKAISGGMSNADAFDWFKTSAAKNGEKVNNNFGVGDVYQAPTGAVMGGDSSTLTDEWAKNNGVNLTPDQAAKLKADYAAAAAQGVGASTALYQKFLTDNNVKNGVDYGTASRFGAAGQGTNQNGGNGVNGGVSQLGEITPWNVTSDQTVQGRIQNVIGENSGLIQQARTRGMETANARGLLNSSIGQTAADSSVYNAALPIATSDASTYAKAAGYNADQTNTFAKFNASANNDYNLAKLNSDTQTHLAELASRDKALIQNSQVASSAYSKYADILYSNSTNPKLDANARLQADQNAFNTYQQQISLSSAMTNMPDVSKYLDFTGINTPAASVNNNGAPAESANNNGTPSGD